MNEEQIIKVANKIKESVLKNKIDKWLVRHCSICDCPLFYYFHPDGTVTFDGSCDCVSYVSYVLPQRKASFEDIAEIYVYSDQNVKDEMDQYFKLK